MRQSTNAGGEVPLVHVAARVRQRFWALVAAAVIAVGFLSLALRMSAGPVAAFLTATSALAAVVPIALAGRIIVVTSRRGVANGGGSAGGDPDR